MSSGILKVSKLENADERYSSEIESFFTEFAFCENGKRQSKKEKERNNVDEQVYL